MRMNKYLTSTLLAGLFATVGLFSPAMGQEQPLEPQGAWAITKIDRSEQGGNSYCTLSRKYTNGVVLSLGRNQTEEFSLAIDFQKSVFEKDKAVKISLQPGPGQIRAYDMMPTSEKAIVVRLGWDTGFFDVLNQSQQMKVKIADQGYSFAMPEIAKGQDELQACMEDLKTAGKKSGQDVQKTAQTKDVLNAEAMQASNEFSAGKVDANTNSAGSINAQKQKVAEQEKAVVRSFAKSMSEQEGKKVVQTEPPQKPSRPETAPMASAQDGKAAEVQKQLDAMRAQNAALEQKLAMAELEKSKLADPKLLTDAQNKMEQLAAEKARLENNLRESNMKLQTLAATPPVPDKSAEVASLQKMLNVATTENQMLKQKMASVDAQAKAGAPLKSENDSMKLKLASMEQANTKLEQELLAAKMAKIEPTSGEADSKAAAEIATLKKQIADLTAQNTALKNQPPVAPPASAPPSLEVQKQLDAAMAEKKALQDKIALLEKQAAQTKPGDLSKVEEKARELEAKNAQLEESLRQAQVRIGEAAVNTGSKSLRQIAELETKLEAAQKDNLTLAKQLEDMKLKQENNHMAAVAGDWDLEQATKRYNEAQREVRRLGLQIEQASATCNAEKSKIEQMLFDPAVADQKQIERLSELQAQLDEANAKLSDKGLAPVTTAQNNTPAGDSLTPMPVPAVTRYDAVASDVNPAIKKQLADLEAAMGKIKSDNDALRNENASLKARTGNLQQQIADAQGNGARADKVASIQLQMDEMKRQMALKDAQNATYQNQLAQTQQERAALQKQLATVDKVKVTPRVAANEPTVKQYSNIQPAAGSVSGSGVAAPSGSFGKGNVANILQKAGLANGVQKASSGYPGADNYAWVDSSSVKGLASIKAVDGDFNKQVNQYIAYQKSQCRGDFASMPSPAAGSAAKTMALYEMACVGGAQSLSSSVVFYQEGGKFVAISNQTDANDMDVAMDSRDKIAGAIRGM